ncbi:MULTISPECIES: winged helix-turn-helix domain-containing protein [Serratia]|nr:MULTISPECIES: helix-turn-helix domain-containing protein [Serratia]
MVDNEFLLKFSLIFSRRGKVTAFFTGFASPCGERESIYNEIYLDTRCIMEFIINGVVKYNSSDGTLFCPDNTVDMITLTRVANELLLLFINNNHVSLRRDDILSELWEKRGLSASSNNLNNYVSMLRKALEQCGLVGLITTIPKHGFIFDADIILVTQGEDVKGNQPVVENALLAPLPAYNETVVEPPSRSHSSSLKVKAIALLVTAILMIVSPSAYNYVRLKLIRTEIFSMDNCNFYLLDDKIDSAVGQEDINNIKDIAIKEKLNCKLKANVYYFSEEMLDVLGRDFVSKSLIYCPYKNKIPCENYHFQYYEK